MGKVKNIKLTATMKRQIMKEKKNNNNFMSRI